VTFTPSGSEKFLRATDNHVGKRVAILIDGQVVASPSLKSAIRSSAEINGNFTHFRCREDCEGHDRAIAANYRGLPTQ
jgi:preprotein translocase subunit SecD